VKPFTDQSACEQTLPELEKRAKEAKDFMNAIKDAAGNKSAEIVFQLDCIDMTPQDFRSELNSLSTAIRERTGWSSPERPPSCHSRGLCRPSCVCTPNPASARLSRGPLRRGVDCVAKVSHEEHTLVPEPGEPTLASAWLRQLDDVPLDSHLDQPSALGSPRRRILGGKITDCRPVKLVAAMSEQRQEPIVQKTG
jgi:hypothetical protein